MTTIEETIVPAERPVGRAAVIEAALSAAADLFADNNYSSVSVREIARRAGVSHALVHRYLGYKEDIFRAVIEWERKQAAEFWNGVDSSQAIPYPGKGGYKFDRYIRTLLRARIEGIEVPLEDEDLLGPQRLLALMKQPHPDLPREQTAVDPRYLLLIASSANIAYTLAPDFFRTLVGLQDEDQETVTAGLVRAVQLMVASPHGRMS